MAGVGVVPSDEALETITLQAYQDYSKSSAQSISKTEFADWVLKFASGNRNGEVASVKEVSLQTAMEQFGVASSQSHHCLNEEDSSVRDDENNHRGYENASAADVAIVSHDNVSVGQDYSADGVSGDYVVDADHFEPGEQQNDAAEHFAPDDQHDEIAAQYAASEQHDEAAEQNDETAEQYEASDQYNDTDEQSETADQHELIAAQVDPAGHGKMEAQHETATHHDDSVDQHEAAKLPGVSVDTLKSAGQDAKPAGYEDDEEDYADEQQQEEESGPSDQGQAGDASRDEEYDEEYHASVEDAVGSAESHDLPSEPHDHDPLSDRDGHDPPIENDSNGASELVATAKTHDGSDHPASSSVGDIKGEGSDTVVDSVAAQPMLSRPPSAILTETSTEGNGGVLDQGSEEDTESTQVVQPAEDAPIFAVEALPTMVIGVDASESHSPDDSYEEEFAHETLAEGETQEAQLEEGDLNEYSIDEHQDETAETPATSCEPPDVGAGAGEAPPSTGEEEVQETEEAANSESSAEAGVEPPHPETMDAADHAIGSEQQHGEEAEAGTADKGGEEFEDDEVVNSGSVAEEQTPQNGQVDVNAFDTYDYEDAAYDASSGLPPPEPTDESENESPAPAEPALELI